MPRWRLARAQPSQGWPRRLEDLDCADDANRVVQVNARIGIERKQPVAQGLGLEGLQLSAERWIWWDARQAEAVRQGFDVQHGSALDDRQLAPSSDVLDRAARTLDVLGRVVVGRRIDEVDHVVSHSTPLFG